ncbi:permease [Robbsia andropogonis]|uniref:Lipopolysaccharide export system permease protein LptF n=1 Tax=Robbsia andropogonis TaxID=28092 RepID=A0A0F5K4Y1_9BURK|nr:LPS export ABC transporter permease LptF [Robbsia andropogonis]KKB65143.1 permease [Robbsia andropogonis]MCP1121090.1 LPS export ABC transporter permease LptF [Robbsia andropogonis]MCP1130910.1 LPS export ABC transporter permease LptF [Robbsia andropogonis]
MIFQRSLQRELAATAGAVFMVLVTIMLTTMMIRVIGSAAVGKIDPHDVLVLIGLTMVGYLAVMMIVTLFVSILVVLTRWYRDSEMVVWQASGLSLTALIPPVAMFSAPIIVAIAFCSLVAWPWASNEQQKITARFQQRDDLSLILAGQFRESATNHRVFFVEKLSADQAQVQNVFVTSTENGKLFVVVSKQGQIETQPNGDRFVVLENGRRYDGEPGHANFRVVEFKRYGVKMDDKPTVDTQSTRGTPSLALLQNPSPDNLAELAWRLGLPMTGITLMLLAIPLAYQNPRRGRTINMVFAVLVYLTYSNLQNLMQNWIEQRKISFAFGLLALHIIVACLASFLLWRRIQNRPLFTLRLRRAK